MNLRARIELSQDGYGLSLSLYIYIYVCFRWGCAPFQEWKRRTREAKSGNPAGSTRTAMKEHSSATTYRVVNPWPHVQGHTQPHHKTKTHRQSTLDSYSYGHIAKNSGWIGTLVVRRNDMCIINGGKKFGMFDNAKGQHVLI